MKFEGIVHNILIIGGEQQDRIKYATQFAQKTLCQNLAFDFPCTTCTHCQRIQAHRHPNVIFIEPQGSSNDDAPKRDVHDDGTSQIKIEQIRRIVVESHKANFEDGFAIFVITHMHRTTKSAANALLKVIEENHHDKIFLALSPSKMTVLPTIASRLICHYVKPSQTLDLPSEDERDTIVRISQTPPRERFVISTHFSTERDELLRRIEGLRETCHAMVRKNQMFPRFALELLEALKECEVNLKKNLNPRLTLEHLILKKWPYSATLNG